MHESAPLGTQASTSLGVSLVVRLERHIALNFGVRASVFGWAPERVAGCSDVERLLRVRRIACDESPVGHVCGGLPGEVDGRPA